MHRKYFFIRKILLFLIISFGFASKLNAQNIEQSFYYRLSSHIIEYMERNRRGDPVGDQIIDLFIEVFNDRHNLSIWRTDTSREELRKRRTQLRGEAFLLLNAALHELGFGSDGQDTRNFHRKAIGSLMTLSILTTFAEERFIEPAKSIAYGDKRLDYPQLYKIINFLEIMQMYDNFRISLIRQHPSFPVNVPERIEGIISRLVDLQNYLTRVLEVNPYDMGFWIERDVIFIGELIQLLRYEVAMK
ncbi:MAG: hypothetical protein FWC36_03155 [Spirochaetes bacterium]|nr:hypothetical protein [Spirochaetota bacterium]